MKITVFHSSIDYERSHWKKPSGRGGWAFLPTFFDEKGNSKDGELIWTNGTLTEARKLAADKAREIMPEGTDSISLDVQS